MKETDAKRESKDFMLSARLDDDDDDDDDDIKLLGSL